MRCRKTQVRELSNFLATIPGMTLVCGDFNVNSLPESADMRAYYLAANPRNNAFLDEASTEYDFMASTLGAKDVVLSDMGEHPRTFLYMNTCREMNRKQ